MVRNVLAVLAAVIVWGLVGVPVNQLLVAAFAQPEGAAPTFGYLLGSLVASFGYSVVAGAVARWVAEPTLQRIGLYAGIALLAVGIAVQAAAWALFPVWYHLIFLAMLVPMAVIGAGLVRRNAAAAP